MIFLSHNSRDKAVVEPVALRLRDLFGQDQVFYDSWSIQPGDGIIARMNAGLADCRAFVLFVSANSLQSKMVDLEWQNALMKAAGGSVRIIPVRLDSSLMPPVLLQTLYVDMFSNGFEVGLRQLIDVLQGKSTFRPGAQTVQNLAASLKREGKNSVIEVRAIHFMEPISQFVVLVENTEGELTFSLRPEGMHTAGFNKDVKLDGGRVVNGQLMGIDRATTPGFPFIIVISPAGNSQLKLVGLLHQKSHDRWEGVPIAMPAPEVNLAFPPDFVLHT